jgi:hypothetical protein
LNSFVEMCEIALPLNKFWEVNYLEQIYIYIYTHTYISVLHNLGSVRVEVENFLLKDKLCFFFFSKLNIENNCIDILVLEPSNFVKERRISIGGFVLV